MPSVLLFTGEEEHLKQQALMDLRKALLPAGLEDLNETILENPESDALIAAAETMPFMADRRLVLVRDLAALEGRSEPDERLLNYLPQAPDYAVLLFFCAKKADERKKLFKAVQKLNGIVSFDPLKGSELTSFVTDAFRKLGRECDQHTADYLIFLSGSDTNRLLTEVAKISAYHPDAPAVDPEDVKALAVPSAEANVFQMVDAVVAGQETRAFRLLRDTLRGGEDPIRILALLLRQFRLMQHVKIMQYEKRNASDIPGALGVSPYAARQYIRQTQLWSPSQVRDAVRLCLDTDLAVKSGELPARAETLEDVMLRLLLTRTPKNEGKIPQKYGSFS